MTNATTMPTAVHERLLRARRNMILSIPFQLGVIALLTYGAHFLGGPLDPKLIGLGALGWFIALALRGPVAVLSMKLMGKEKAQAVVVGSSGPLEEGVRLALLLWLVPSWPTALAVGLGWAAIEVVFAVVNGLVGNMLLSKDDDKAREARELLDAQGMLRETDAHWGVIERIFASLAHFGFTFLAAASPLWLLLTVPLHSGMNFGVVKLSRRSLALAEGAMAVVLGCQRNLSQGFQGGGVGGGEGLGRLDAPAVDDQTPVQTAHGRQSRPLTSRRTQAKNWKK